MRYIIEFDTHSELADNASEGIYKALVSVLGNIGNFRILCDSATFIGYVRAKDQPIMWREVSREP
jgi:hypothetical protein